MESKSHAKQKLRMNYHVATDTKEVYKAENEKLKRYLAKYGIDASKIEE